MLLRLTLGAPITTLLMQHSLVPTAAARWVQPGAPQRGLALARSARPPLRHLAASAASGSKFGALPNEPELPFAVRCGRRRRRRLLLRCSFSSLFARALVLLLAQPTGTLQFPWQWARLCCCCCCLCPALPCYPPLAALDGPRSPADALRRSIRPRRMRPTGRRGPWRW